MKILVTGANGFIGKKLCSILSSSYEVIALDIRKDVDSFTKYQFVECDLSNSTLLKSQINFLPATVIHCAGLAHQKLGTFNRETYIKVNSESTENLAMVTAKNNKLHFIFLSSISVYGENHIIQPISEDAIRSPSSDYALSKLVAEKRLVRLYEEGLLKKLTILRLAPVYDREWCLNLDRRVFAPKKLAYLKFGKGTQRMSALARPNLIEFIEHLIKRASTSRGVEILNVCDSNPYSFNQIIRSFKYSGIHPPRPTITIPLPFVWSATRLAGAVMRHKKDWLHSCYDKLTSDLVFDNSKMLQTGFNPKHTLNSIFS